MRFALVLLHYRYPEITAACLKSLARADVSRFTVYLVNNSPEDGTGRSLQEKMQSLGLAFVYRELPGNPGFSAGVNAGLQAALRDGFDWTVILNNDTRVEPDFAERVLTEAEANPGTVLGALVLDPRTGLPSYGVGRLGRWTFAPRHHLTAEPQDTVDFVSGCFLAAPRAVYEKVGFFREEYFMYAEDTEFCVRLRKAGIKVRFAPSIRIWHEEGSSSDRANVAKHYYRLRNHAALVLTHGTVPQKLAFALHTALLMAYKLRHPRMFVVFARALRDALRGRMGKTYVQS